MEQNTPLKRQREVEEKEESLKKQKSFKDIITLLEEEEDEPNQDISFLLSTLQEELSSGSSDPSEPESEPEKRSVVDSGSGEEVGEKVMRHLLEASDDELGIPSGTDGLDSSVGGEINGGDLLFPVEESLWEIEDLEAANYYNLLQSEIFM